MKRFKNILYVADAGQRDADAFARAVTLAENNQADLTVVAVVARAAAGIGMPAGGPISEDLQAALMAARAQALETLVEPHRGQLHIRTRVLQGVSFLEIVRAVLRDGYDLVIKAPETHDWLARLFGSEDMHLLRKCPCPVWLARADTPGAYRRILAAVDVDDGCPPAEWETRHALNRQVLEMASSLALAEFAELHIAHAWEAPYESAVRSGFIEIADAEFATYLEGMRRQRQHNLEQLLGELRRADGEDLLEHLKPQTHLVKGQARKEIPTLARQLAVDLIVMGTVARTGVPGFFVGNTAESILNQIECSVLAIKPAGFVTPVTLED